MSRLKAGTLAISLALVGAGLLAADLTPTQPQPTGAMVKKAVVGYVLGPNEFGIVTYRPQRRQNPESALDIDVVEEGVPAFLTIAVSEGSTIGTNLFDKPEKGAVLYCLYDGFVITLPPIPQPPSGTAK